MWTLAAEGPNGRFLPSDINEFIWGSLAFLVVVAVMIWKFAGPVKAAMAARTARISDELAVADNAKAEAEAHRQAQLAKLGDADAEAAKIVADARTRAASMKTDLMAKAESDVEASKVKARSDIEMSKGQALSDIRAEAAQNAANAAEAVVNDNLDDARLASLIENYIAEVGS